MFSLYYQLKDFVTPATFLSMQTIFGDAASAYPAVFRTMLPHAQQVWCIWHLQNNVRVNCEHAEVCCIVHIPTVLSVFLSYCVSCVVRVSSPLS